MSPFHSNNRIYSNTHHATKYSLASCAGLPTSAAVRNTRKFSEKANKNANIPIIMLFVYMANKERFCLMWLSESCVSQLDLSDPGLCTGRTEQIFISLKTYSSIRGVHY